MTSFHPKSSKSSYFPYSHDGGEGGKEEDSASMVHSRPLPASPSRKPVTAEEADSLSLAMLSHGIHFPQHDGILWDRTGLTAPRYCLVERDVLPALILTRQDLLYLLQTLTMPPHSNNHDNNNNNNSKSSATQPMTTGGVECVGSVFASSELPSAHRQVLSCYPTTTTSSAGGSNPSGSGGANYGFVLNQANNRQVGLDMNFTIPITRRQFASDSQVLQFDPQSYSAMRQNLWKSLRSSRSFAFRHFVRMRAIGYANSMDTPSLHKTPVPSSSSSSTSSSSSPSKRNRNTWHKGIARFEVILPEMSFQFVGIPAIPILATPLCLNLLSNSTEMFSTSDSLPSVGYVTLNQTRKVVFMLDNDHHAIARTPLVGVWLRLPPSSLANSSGNATDHPIVWAACVRYMLSERISQRVFIATDTFLLVLIIGEMVQYFEVTMLPVKKGETEEELVSFLTLDFTADLSVESDNDAGSDAYESLVCKFKATNKYNLRNPLPATAGVTSRTFKMSPPPPPEDSSSMTSNPPVPRQLPSSIANKFTNPSSATHPLLVGSSNESSPSNSYYESAPACYSSLLTAQKFEQQVLRSSSSSSQQHQRQQAVHQSNQESHSLQTNPTLAMPAHRYGIPLSDEVSDHAQYTYSFPAEIIASQQRQLSLLQQQVDDLRQLVLSLGGRLPASEQNSSFATANLGLPVTIPKTVEVKQSTITAENNDRNQSISSKTSDLLSFSLIDSSSDEKVQEQNSKIVVDQDSSLLEALMKKSSVLNEGEPVTEVTLDQIEQQYIPSNEDSKEVVNRLIPNLHQVSMQTLLLSQQQPGLLERIGEEEVNIASFAHDDEEEENDHDDNQEDEEGSIAHSTASASRSYTTQRSNPVGSNRYLSTTSPHGVRSTTHSYHGKSSRAVPLPKKKSPISKFQQISQQLDLDDTTEAPSMVFESDSILAIQHKYLK